MYRRYAPLIALAIGFVGIFVGVVFAAEPPPPWMSADTPTLQNVVQLADNSALPESNHDCDRITTRIASSTAMVDDCVVQSPLGLASQNGIIFNGSSELMPISPPAVFTGLNPIPGQEMVYTYTSASSFGLYMHFYRSIRDKLLSPSLVNGRWQYTLTQNPDFTLKNLSGKSQTINPATLAFSQNGQWMVVDFPYQGFVRVNLATFETVPFAPSLNTGQDTSSYSAQITVNNDGRYVAMRPKNAEELRLYDIQSCAGAVLPVSPSDPKCKSRNYWNDMTASIPGLKAIYQPRFTSDMQLTMTAQYDYKPGSYRVAQYTLTAPGIDPSGMEYLGMGDSFASGQGAFNYIAGTDTEINRCHLSSLSYPFLLSSSLFSSGRSIACSGARTYDITDISQGYTGQVYDGITREKRTSITEILHGYKPGYLPQLDFLTRHNPRTITLSIGGNDIGFSDIIKRCVMPAVWHTTCYPTKEDQEELVKRIQGVQSKLQNVYRTVSQGGRRVYVIGYPQIVKPGGNCANNVHLDEAEIGMFIDLTYTLNETIKQAAAKAGVHYVDVSNAFIGHRMCETGSGQVAVNGFTAGNDAGPGGLKFIGAESYHPNALGHELLWRAILGQTNNFKNYTKTQPTSPSSSPLPYPGAAVSGRSVNMTVSDDSLVPDVLTAQSPVRLRADPRSALLKSSASYNVRLDTSTATITTLTTNSLGELQGTIAIPPSVACGPHTLHVYGPGMANQPLDVYKEIYVDTPDCAAARTACGLIPLSGTDHDQDGTDDACDAVISDPPSIAAQRVYLTTNTIHVARP